MNCPNCNETLVMADRQGVEIDYCPKCRGVWLDRGELDKIIERSTAFYSAPESNKDTFSSDEEARKYYPKADEHYHDPRYRHKKKKGFLGDLFDFD
jgi:Zn-finger nucleic acid-binding protein